MFYYKTGVEAMTVYVFVLTSTEQLELFLAGQEKAILEDEVPPEDPDLDPNLANGTTPCLFTYAHLLDLMSVL